MLDMSPCIRDCIRDAADARLLARMRRGFRGDTDESWSRDPLPRNRLPAAERGAGQ
jgi:hypothetical protein